MSTFLFKKPLLPSHYSVWCDPPDESGDELLYFVSEQRSLKLKGHSFREFQQRVIPLLDGRHTTPEIEAATADVFRPEDLSAGLSLLAAHGLLTEGEGHPIEGELAERLTPQLNFFHEATQAAPQAQARLSQATVTVIGLGGAGSAVAQGLSAAGVGHLRCADAGPVTPTDVYLSGFAISDIGQERVQALERRIAAIAPQVKVSAHARPLASEEEVRALVDGSDFVVCCLDPGQSNLIFKLNRACLSASVRWVACTLAGVEVILGPTVNPYQSACYLCYRMRAVACAGNPEDAFAYEQYLDRRKKDESSRRENLVFGAGLAASLVGLEVLRVLTGVERPMLVGKIQVLNLLDSRSSEHVVLRKPYCPACFRKSV